MELLTGLVALVTIVSALWVLFDAPARDLSRWWALGVFLIWVVFLPWYVVVRSRRPVLPTTPPTRRTGWFPDPRDPTSTERLREGERWTRITRPRGSE